MRAQPLRLARLELRSKATSRLVCLVGLIVTIAALAADTLTGAAKIEIGIAQLLGCFAGVGIFAAGILLLPGLTAIGSTTIRWVAALYLAACALTLSLIWPMAAATWILLGYVAAACVLLPPQFGVLTLVGVLTLHVLLTWISSVKTDLTGLPLTVLDIEIALANPAGLWDSLSLPHWTRHLAVATIALASLGWLAAGLAAGRRLFVRRLSRSAGRDAVAKFVAVGAFGILIYAYLQALYADAEKDQSTWHTERVTRLANRVGILPFLAYSYHLESRAAGEMYRTDSTASPPSAEEIRAAVLQYMDFESAADTGLSMPPNILVVLAESTFDPGEVFRLQGEWNDELFRPNKHSVAEGLLRVNAEGGGTWITEFETIVGLDSRLFGYSGMYTHASLSPFVEHSLATYMREHGYQTWAFFPHGGDFYNARHAYENYGFENILDSADLGKGNWIETDVEIADSVQERMGLAPEEPFFGYLLFIENHSPHECDVTDRNSFKVRLADTLDFAPNCALHDYLRRLDSTTSAVRSLITYLAGIENRTGRPFVLLVFGDHQPYTFTSTKGTQYNFGALRRLADTHATFFHIESSAPGKRLRCCSPMPPATVLPTLVSGFVARGPDDIYLGVNLWLHARCGSDAVRHDFGDRMGSLEIPSLDDRSAVCKAAYERALAWYRTSGIMRLGSGPSP